jgi:uncharacterized protein (DUF342 family)
MAKIKASQVVNATRSVNVTLTFDDDEGNRHTEATRVIYRALSVRRMRELAEKTEVTKKEFSEQLAEMVVSLPDVVDEADKPYPINSEFFESLSLDNLKAISEGISNDIAPPSQPSAS